MLTVLRWLGRALFGIGPMVAVGGAAQGLITDPWMAALIAGLSGWLGRGIVIYGDWLDNKKLDGSFTIDGHGN